MSNTAPPAGYVYAVAAIWPPLCTAAVILRFYARRVHSGGSGWSIDDWLVVPATILTWALGTILIVGVAQGSLAHPTPKAPEGVSQDSFSSPESQGARRDFWLFKLCQIIELTLIKLSFVFFYRRIFCARTNNQTFDRLTKFVIGLLILWGVAFFFSLLLACGGHFDKYWQAISIVTEYCPHTLYWENTFAVTDMVMDLVVYILPLRQVTLLNLTFHKKLALFGIFGFGAVTVAASILRMSFFIYVLRVDFKSDTDNDLIITSGFYWSMLESGLALLAVNLPPIYSLINIKSKRKRDRTMTPHNAYTSRRKWVQNLSNFRSVRDDGAMFSESEIAGFKTGVVHGENVSLEDVTPHGETADAADQIRVENRVEVTWHDATHHDNIGQADGGRPYSRSQQDLAFPLKAHSMA